jgi:hypothetical protein
LWPIKRRSAEERGFAELVGINFAAGLEINPFVFLFRACRLRLTGGNTSSPPLQRLKKPAC